MFMIPNISNFDQLKTFLDDLVDRFNRPEFIPDDPISIPHQFENRQDIEIMGFWVSVLSWGQRSVIIRKATELIDLFEGQPHQFILNHKEQDRARFANFKHRTFQYTDSLYFLDFLQRHYIRFESLEDAFLLGTKGDKFDMRESLTNFHEYFFDAFHAPKRTRKHLASPARNSRCKRLNMFLRWMVRKDDKGVDFGIWDRIPMSALHLPLDVHVEKSARKLGLIARKQNDWKTVVELTENMRKLDPDDPARYDFSLFGMGLMEKDGQF